MDSMALKWRSNYEKKQYLLFYYVGLWCQELLVVVQRVIKTDDNIKIVKALNKTIKYTDFDKV